MRSLYLRLVFFLYVCVVSCDSSSCVCVCYSGVVGSDAQHTYSRDFSQTRLRQQQGGSWVGSRLTSSGGEPFSCLGASDTLNRRLRSHGFVPHSQRWRVMLSSDGGAFDSILLQGDDHGMHTDRSRSVPVTGKRLGRRCRRCALDLRRRQTQTCERCFSFDKPPEQADVCRTSLARDLERRAVGRLATPRLLESCSRGLARSRRQ